MYRSQVYKAQYCSQAALVLTTVNLNIFVQRGVDIIISIESTRQGEQNSTTRFTPFSTNFSGYTRFSTLVGCASYQEEKVQLSPDISTTGG